MKNSGELKHLEQLSRAIRYWILQSTTEAGSGHPSSALSAVELMTALIFGGYFHYDLENPGYANNDRLIFSKGHASPLFYAIWVAAGGIPESDMKSYRQFGSVLEGHPTTRFKYTEAATGSLGQGLSIGLGMALNAKYLDELPYHTYVLLGDGEMAEGSQWEAIQLAAHYRTSNLTAILDVNRLGQTGETMYGHDLEAYEKRFKAFNWHAHVVEDGHDIGQIQQALDSIKSEKERPGIIIARTIKGKGVSLIENKYDWHGKALSDDQHKQALNNIGEVDASVRGRILLPEQIEISFSRMQDAPDLDYKISESVATRVAYGKGLRRIARACPDIVVLDGEVSNSTYAKEFKEECPERFFEMFIAEQNMVGTALGLSIRGKVPFVSTFAAFFSRAFDQIRMCPYSEGNIKFAGSHAGVSIGEDGASQMGLEDIALFRTIPDCLVFYPADAVSTERILERMANHRGLSYIRLTRSATPVIYPPHEEFTAGGSKTLHKSSDDDVTIISAGITLHEALKAYGELQKTGIKARIIDLYSVKPLDQQTIKTAADETSVIVTVEDHYPEGGIGEAVCSVLTGHSTPVYSIAVRKRPLSGPGPEQLKYQQIDADGIKRTVEQLLFARKEMVDAHKEPLLDERR